MQRRRIAAVVLVLAATPALGGCWNGYNALTTTQPNSGDAAEANVGDVSLRGLSWVRDLANPKNATLVGSFVLAPGEPDELVSVTTDPTGYVVGITDGKIALLPGSENRVGYNSDKFVNLYGTIYDTNTPQSTFINTTFQFKRAGVVSVPVLVVPNTGPFRGIRPNPPDLFQRPSGEPIPSGSPSASPAATGAPTAAASPATASAPAPAAS